ncbi:MULTISPECIES: DUF6164 family protein [unclassified Luteimonas]|uniref:DUF6164 family protein n=1 Tax=unclassified Luteimonas TaxID=2629088 RepID=UPI0018F0DCFC|nr:MULTISPECIES: DUF6164 family protein [unclassified Luteimonas]MBJ6980799.1 hypothetical protein [Luteimonas sp. MC1572]MBJ7573937.1 hypothetical protein [Luteimonas sp. MC1828]QQO02164.1 hypothetical protein JGR64_08000 [Luteimonas sp. MC1572]
MAKLLLNMRMVPDDEADDVRAFLEAHAIAFHETLPSRWGISYGGIWVSDDADFPKARRLMDEYQARRQAQAREARALELREGRAETLRDVARAEPLRVLVTAIGIVLLLALVALPVMLLWRAWT